MRIIEPSYKILRPQAFTVDTVEAIYAAIAAAARTCYQSSGANDAQLVRKLVENGHEAMLEHASMMIKFIVDRGVSHELVRHRIASYAQESTRYCNYSKGKFGNEITVIRPVSFEPDTEAYDVWKTACEEAEQAYFRLLSLGVAPEFARNILPTSLKTEIVVTMNLREWRHFFRLRALGVDGKPHPQMQQVALPLMRECAAAMPELLEDLEGETK